MDEIIVQVQFKASTAYGEFRDALNIPKAEYDSLSQAEIDDRKQTRVDNWVSYMDSPKVSVAPTKAQLQIQAAELSSRLSELNTKIAGM